MQYRYGKTAYPLPALSLTMIVYLSFQNHGKNLKRVQKLRR